MNDSKTSDRRKVWGILLAALLLRGILMLLCKGYATDVACFVAWADNMALYGPGGFYTAGFFADYPPGYLYWLWAVGAALPRLGLETGGTLGLFIMGLPTLLCDLLLAYLGWRLCRDGGHPRAGLLVCGALAFSPALLFNVGVWKQVDSILALLLVLCFLLLEKKRWYAAAVVYGLATLVKPQALILGPVLALGYLLPLFSARAPRERLKILGHTAGSALLCVAVILLGALPFQGSQHFLWLPEKYFSTMSYYSYGTVNAFNLFGALGGNWQSADSGWLLSYSQWGILLIGVSTVFVVWLGCCAARRGRLNLPLLAALYGLLVFTFAHSMHERYSLPFLVLLLFGWTLCRDRTLLRCFAAQSVLCFFNIAMAFWCLSDEAAYGSSLWGASIRLGGVLQVCVCLWLAVCCVRLFRGTGAVEWLPAQPAAPAPWRAELPWNRRDALYILLPTLLCAMVSFWNLGAMEAPETAWHSGGPHPELRFDPPAHVAQIWSYSGIADGFVELWQGNGESPLLTINTPYGNMYRWEVVETDLLLETVTLRGYDAAVNELVFLDDAGNTLTPVFRSPSIAPLFDEQGLRPQRPSSHTGMYFDEIYHGRTAYEHLHGLAPYENSHPPLGKILIMLGIKLFGMNPFGWRFMGTLFGVLLLPLLYLMGRLLLGSREYALLGMTLLALDCMRFTQSRIATIDTYAVFFILAAYYFMLHWLRHPVGQGIGNVMVPHGGKTSLFRQLFPLALSGLCFGLACAVKWVGVYAGFGLAVLFFGRLWQEREHRDWTLKMIAAGFAFFVAVPLAVYLLAYLPYYLCAAGPYGLSEVWDLQSFMLTYHGQLTATHPFESRWFDWPLIRRPIWYSMGTRLPAGMASSIALLGNPAVWWSGAAAMAFLLASRIWNRREPGGNFLCVAFLSQYLPWVFISRSTFLYHYFPSLPFVILALCLLLQRLAARRRPLRWLPLGLATVSLGLFVWFFPALCDLPVTLEYAQSLLWFKDWAFYWLV